MQSVKSQPTFRRNISLPSSESKNKQSKKPEQKHVASLFFDPEDGGDIFL
jgi:hypothetical protein